MTDYGKPIIVGCSVFYITCFTGWLFEIQKLMVQLVEQGKAANTYMLRNERGIEKNSEEIIKLKDGHSDHETRIKVIESRP